MNMNFASESNAHELKYAIFRQLIKQNLPKVAFLVITYHISAISNNKTKKHSQSTNLNQFAAFIFCCLQDANSEYKNLLKFVSCK